MTMLLFMLSEHNHTNPSLCLANNITTDQSALLTFKSNIISDPHNTLTTNWSISTSCCNWIGVTCDIRRSRVVALDLSNMQLTATIHADIAKLSVLVSLDLYNNSFDGTLPGEVSNLRKLTRVDLGLNFFTGDLPSWLINLPDITYLSLSNNSFTGTIPPFSNTSKLEKLKLGNNLFRGNIPKEIASLDKLKVLEMQGNQLSGSVPCKIFNISALRLIDISYNGLSGDLPWNICHGIPNIQELHLSVNEFSGQLPSALHECSNLRVLSLSRNKLSGIMPREIGNLSMVEELDLGENNLTGTIPQEIGRLGNLKLLALHVNDISGFLPETLFNISKLEIIKLFNNQLSGSLPSDFGLKQPSLRKIYLGSNHLTGTLPHSISNATKLVFFDVSGNEFTGTIPESFGNLRLLEFLGFGTNNLTNDKSSSELSFITSLTNCRNLKTLIADKNPLNGFLPPTIGNFSSALELLWISESGIKGTFIEEIGNLRSLRGLLLYGNELTGKIPASIKHLTKLEDFNLYDNKIGGVIPEDVCHLQRLVYLVLARNQLSGPVPACLGNIASLRYLYLSSNRLNSSLPASLGQLRDLLNFSVSTNSLSGHIPFALGNLKVAIHIDLSKNQFSGNIPTNLGNLQSLVNLSLARNRLQGPIPDTFEHAVSLEYFDLSSNRLSSVIPRSLETLKYLKYFNVSSNSLSGEIPSEGPFRNFTGQSFLANEALCGASRYEVIACSNSVNHGSKKRLKILLFVGVPLMIASLLFVLVFTSILITRNKSNVQPEAYDLAPITRRGRISYHELQKATDGFNESNMLGMGSFGSVYKGVLENGTVVAVKVFNLEVEGGFKSFDVECEVLRRVRHRNLGHVISSCSNADFKALVLEYMPNGSLEKWLYSHNHFLDLLQRIDIMIDVGCALDYLHCGYLSPVVHCDLKPSNVLLDNNMVAHLTDFGVTKLLGEGESVAQTITLATYGYMAPGNDFSGYMRTRIPIICPIFYQLLYDAYILCISVDYAMNAEYGMEGLVSRKSDVYSYGIMLMEVFTRTKPSDEHILGDLSLKSWVSKTLSRSAMEIIDANLLIPKDVNITTKLHCVTSIMELALCCAADSPKARITMRDVLKVLENIKADFHANQEWT